MTSIAPNAIPRPVFKLGQPDDNYKYQPLPPPPGKYPYRLTHAGKNTQQLCFHMVGDTGGMHDTEKQHRVAVEMTKQYLSAAHQPEFLFHLGDLVYNYGEAGSYAQQFFQPYEKYPGHIYAIAGNHDSDVNPVAIAPYKSLDAFAAVFCDIEHRRVTFGGDTNRKSGIQPHIYWTLETPLATIIGMHSNVPKYGVVDDEQIDWFKQELKHAGAQRPNKAVIVAVHHAPYSADTNHGSSEPMINLLEGIFEETGIRPDLVASGHVHNYQRFQKSYADGKALTYLVAGAGGYDELHPLAGLHDPRYSAGSDLFSDIDLLAWNDTRHGFLKIDLEKNAGGFNLIGEYYIVDALPGAGGTLADRFLIKLA
ncbi:metallophosphoesterase [Mucilaginibacter mali]|uniref:Metallophosphoesterase n=1 Tax=Mucilaginibacter mali TaxID=2740462 RepID=A0A7D4QEE3_9SPHI|nr:metallophosphoesterase [Mucilaginibacter mali]QKJ32064.1 metallophosphoesterase [Mucilaginibacter mali]